MPRKIRVVMAAAAAVSLLLLPAVVPAKGGGKGGSVYITAKACPDSVYAKKDGNALIAWFKSHKTLEVWEKAPSEIKKTCDARCADEGVESKKQKCIKECTAKEEGWDFWILINLTKPLNDLELTISLYDDEVTPRHLVNSFAMMLMQKNEKILTQRVRLHHADGFESNHRYQLEISSKKVIKATQALNLRGVPVVYSGEVDFSSDEGE